MLPWQILGAIREVATAREAGEFFCLVSNARFRRCPVGYISRNLNTTTSIGEAVKTHGTEFGKIYRKGSFYQKRNNVLKFLRPP